LIVKTVSVANPPVVLATKDSTMSCPTPSELTSPTYIEKTFVSESLVAVNVPAAGLMAPIYRLLLKSVEAPTYKPADVLASSAAA